MLLSPELEQLAPDLVDIPYCNNRRRCLHVYQAYFASPEHIHMSNCSNLPKVSVCVITYNHVDFVRECLQSLVDQKTTFRFEVIVEDDCSTDGTQEIVKEFAARYPDIVHAVLHDENLGPATTYFHLHGLACGEYIAYLDGDDYALPGKLQAQSDFLDTNPQCNIVWHRMYVTKRQGGALVDDLIQYERLPQGGFSRGDLLRYMTIGMNSSKMYRSSVRDFNLPPFPSMDFLINVEQIGGGTACFSGKEPLGVYRAGIGIASRGKAIKIIQRQSIEYLAKKYPEYATQISTATLGRVLVSVRNGNWYDVNLFLPLLVRHFRFGSIWDIIKNWHLLMMFRLP